MNDAFGAKAEAFLADGRMAGIAAVEIFGHHFGDAVTDPGAQRLANVDLFA
jgi:hypothetical protein